MESTEEDLDITGVVHPQSPSNFQHTSLARNLADLEDKDAIGIIDVIGQALEQLDTLEDLQEIELQSDLNPCNQRERNRGRSKCPYEDLGNDCADAGPQVTTVNLSGHFAPSLGTGEGILQTKSSNISNPDAGPRRRGSLPKRGNNDGEKDEEGIDKDKYVGNDNNGDEYLEGIFGSKAPIPMGKTLSNYFATVGSTREKRLVALSAWLATIIGLVVCLAFVTRDFLQSSQEETVALSYELEDHIELPNTYICAQQIAIPAFNFRRTAEFNGDPLLWVHSAKMPGSNSSEVTYPETVSHDNLETVAIDALGDKCTSSATQYLDADAIWQSRIVAPRCFSCILVKSNPPIRIYRSEVEKHRSLPLDEAAREAAFSVEVSLNTIVSSCRDTSNGLNIHAYFALAEWAKEHLSALRQRGILEMGEANPESDDELSGLYFPRTRELPKFTYTDFISADVVDMLCNTYLFSGYQYPKPPSQDIAFKFNEKLLRWERKTGTKGPYYPPAFEDFWKQPVLDNNGDIVAGQIVTGFSVEEGREARMSQYQNHSAVRLSDGNYFSVFIESSSENTGQLRQVSGISTAGVDTLFFVKQTNNGRVSHSATASPIRLLSVSFLNYRARFKVHLTCKDFLSRRVSDQVTVQVTSFLADFFGLIELFLDLSVYTLILSPLMVRVRRKAIASRLKKMPAASPISPV